MKLHNITEIVQIYVAMGGHGHGETYKVPDYRIYKVADAPPLAQVEKALASQGLKDPWLRNEVWRYDKKWGTQTERFNKIFTRGFKYGFGAFVLTVIGTAIYDKMYPSEHGHKHH